MYELCGPHRYTLKELVQWVSEVTGHPRLVLGLSPMLSMLQARVLELSPVPLMTRDNIRSMQVPSVCDCALPFGLEATALESVAPSWLAPSGPRERYPSLRWRARR